MRSASAHASAARAQNSRTRRRPAAGDGKKQRPHLSEIRAPPLMQRCSGGFLPELAYSSSPLVAMTFLYQLNDFFL